MYDFYIERFVFWLKQSIFVAKIHDPTKYQMIIVRTEKNNAIVDQVRSITATKISLGMPCS